MTTWCPSRTSRRHMFAPIRPSPMKPRCMNSSSADGARDRALEDCQVRVDVGAEPDVRDGSVVRRDRLAVATGLGVDELAERVGPARDRPVGLVEARELEERAGRRPALVELAG